MNHNRQNKQRWTKRNSGCHFISEDTVQREEEKASVNDRILILWAGEYQKALTMLHNGKDTNQHWIELNVIHKVFLRFKGRSGSCLQMMLFEVFECHWQHDADISQKQVHRLNIYLRTFVSSPKSSPPTSTFHFALWVWSGIWTQRNHSSDLLWRSSHSVNHIRNLLL